MGQKRVKTSRYIKVMISACASSKILASSFGSSMSVNARLALPDPSFADLASLVDFADLAAPRGERKELGERDKLLHPEALDEPFSAAGRGENA